MDMNERHSNQRSNHSHSFKYESEIVNVDEDQPSSSQQPPYTIAEHADITFTYFQKLRASHQFLDVRLESNGEVVAEVNRLILAAFSSHFESALIASQHSSCCLNVDSSLIDVTTKELYTIVEYMYSGRCFPTPRLRVAANNLGCHSLIRLIDHAPEGEGEVQATQHPSIFQMQLQKYRQEASLLDCNINTVNKGLIRCHRLLLCAHSKSFESALLTTRASNQVTLNIDSHNMKVSGMDVKSMVEFVYLGVVRGQRRRFRMMRVAADDLGVERMVQVIDAHLLSTAEEEEQQNADDMGYADETTLAEYPLVSIENEQNIAESEDHDEYNGDYDTLGEAYSNSMDDFTAQATEDYVSIYEEYVMGPRRGRRGGTYGINRIQPLAMKGATVVSMAESRENGVTEMKHVPAVMMAYTPGGLRKRKQTDSFGYGLPEFLGTNDVAVPLLVGNQKEMMERPFKCPHCDHRTKEKSGIDKHVRCMHTGEAPYKCKYCNQAFKVQSNLVRHIRAHTGEKPYACKKCGICYADKKNMDAHVYREHLKLQPMTCQQPNCGKRFWRHDRFAHHCHKEHGSVPQLHDPVA